MKQPLYSAALGHRTVLPTASCTDAVDDDPCPLIPAAPVCIPRLPRLLTVDEVAQGVRASKRAVWRWIRDGRLPVVRFGRSVRIRPADYERLIASGLVD